MNFLSVDMLTENIVILLDKSEEDAAKDEVVFPSEEEIYEKINEENEKDEDEDKTVRSGHLNPDEPLAVIWMMMMVQDIGASVFMSMTMKMKRFKLTISLRSRKEVVCSGYSLKLMTFNLSRQFSFCL